jgi:hypothetical protein
VKELSGKAIEDLLASRGVAFSQGRGERIAASLNRMLAASAADAAALALDQEPPAYLLAIEREKTRP